MALHSHLSVDSTIQEDFPFQRIVPIFTYKLIPHYAWPSHYEHFFIVENTYVS